MKNDTLLNGASPMKLNQGYLLVNKKKCIINFKPSTFIANTLQKPIRFLKASLKLKVPNKPYRFANLQP
jgi:hypothetical protein